MAGFVLDVLVEFLFRVMVRFYKAYGAASWPIFKAKVTSVGYRGGLGCAVADITYTYRSDEELYTGADANPFMYDSSAKNYLEAHPRGSELLIRVNPKQPDSSIVRQDDLYRQAHGYRLTTK